MPNWCSNSIQMKFNKPMQEKTVSILKSKDEFFKLFCAFINKSEDELTSEDMGTKWWPFEDNTFDDLKIGDTEAFIFVDSAWGPPNKALEAIRTMLDWQMITNEYIEPGMGFAGVFKTTKEDTQDRDINYQYNYLEAQDIEFYKTNESDLKILRNLVSDEAYCFNADDPSQLLEMEHLLVAEKLVA